MKQEESAEDRMSRPSHAERKVNIAIEFISNSRFHVIGAGSQSNGDDACVGQKAILDEGRQGQSNLC